MPFGDDEPVDFFKFRAATFIVRHEMKATFQRDVGPDLCTKHLSLHILLLQWIGKLRIWGIMQKNGDSDQGEYKHGSRIAPLGVRHKN
jgi:hypothetical protein